MSDVRQDSHTPNTRFRRTQPPAVGHAEQQRSQVHALTRNGPAAEIPSATERFARRYGTLSINTGSNRS